MRIPAATDDVIRMSLFMEIEVSVIIRVFFGSG
jgi:hypothetical protein